MRYDSACEVRTAKELDALELKDTQETAAASGTENEAAGQEPTDDGASQAQTPEPIEAKPDGESFSPDAAKLIAKLRREAAKHRTEKVKAEGERDALAEQALREQGDYKTLYEQTSQAATTRDAQVVGVLVKSALAAALVEKGVPASVLKLVSLPIDGIDVDHDTLEIDGISLGLRVAELFADLEPLAQTAATPDQPAATPTAVLVGEHLRRDEPSVTNVKVTDLSGHVKQFMDKHTS